MEDIIAFTGNWADLRTVFFKFRLLVKEKKIDWARISEIDGAYLRDKIVPSSTWSDQQALFVHSFLKRFQLELNSASIKLLDFESYKIDTKTGAAKIKAEKIIGYAAGKFTIQFPYDPNMVERVKKIPGRKWEQDFKQWQVPAENYESVAAFASANGFLIAEVAKTYINGVDEEEIVEESYSAEFVDLGITLKRDLFPFQTQGVAFAVKVARENPGCGALIADQMGLGKTPQGIAYSILLDQWPVIVICPKGLRYNWKNEFEAWSGKRALVATDRIMKFLPRYFETDYADVIIVNYEGIKKYFVDEVKVSANNRTTVTLNRNAALFKNIIIDEAHELKNQKTTRYKIIKKFMGDRSRLLLTGTPIVNEVNDMASMIELTGHMDKFGDRYHFNETYGSVGKESFDGKKRVPVLAELNKKLRSTLMIRREKHMVLTQLPPKIRQLHEVEISNRADYDHALLSLQDWMAAKGATEESISKSLQAEFMVQLGVLKKLSGIGKVEAVVDFVKQLHAEGEKVVIFAWFKDTLKELKKHFPNMDIISGDMTGDPQECVKAFQNVPEKNIIGLTYKKGGVGFTLTAASNWISIELPWHDAILSQAEDRIHRIGQVNTAYCHHFFGNDTIDEYIYSIIERKRELSKQATGSSESIKEDAADMVQIFNILKKMKKKEED